MFARVLMATIFLLPTAVNAGREAGVVMDPGIRYDSVRRIAALVRDNYVDPEMAEDLGASILQSLESGDFSMLRDPRDLAASLTERLRAHDGHFAVTWQDSHDGPVDEHDDPEAQAAWQEYSRLNNHGFRSVEILPGNIGYLDLRYFDSVDVARSIASAAMAFLASADAFIVDLRENGGGEPGMVQLLCSYFFGNEPVHLNSLYWRAENRTEDFWTLADVEGKRMPAVPLYVLTSRRTGSAAEEFAYNLQTRQRATILGQVTAGAANPGQVFDAGNGFSVFISTGRAINPVTGKNWERVGVIPDIQVPSDTALHEARLRALDGLLRDSATPGRTRVLTWARDAVLSEISPQPVSPGQLRELTGRYGDRTVRMQGGVLLYQRGDRPARTMRALSRDTFLLEGVEGFRTRFERDGNGRIVRMVDAWVEGHEESNPRQ